MVHTHLYVWGNYRQKRCGFLKGEYFYLPPVRVSLFMHLNPSLGGGYFTLRLHQK